MRKVLLLALFVAACSRHEGEGERDKKGRSDTRAGSGLAAAMTGAPVAPIAPPSNTTTTPADDFTIYSVPVGRSPVRGKSDALVTMIEFGDFDCPYCSRVEPTVAAVRSQYGDDVRVVWKNETMKVHAHAVSSACLALEALAEHGAATFWDVHDALYDAPSRDDASLAAIAKQNHIDATKAQIAITKSPCKAVLDEDDALAGRFDARGTPTFFINGRRLVGAQPLARFTHIIDAELAKAKDRVAAGTPRASVYDAITNAGTDAGTHT